MTETTQYFFLMHRCDDESSQPLARLPMLIQLFSAPPLECDLEIGQSISQNWNVDQSVEA